MTAETDLLPLPGVKCWRAMKDRNGNVGYSDKPDPKYSESAGTDGLTWVRLDDHRAALQAYARACVSSSTEALRAKAAEHRDGRLAALERAERLAEALRVAMQALIPLHNAHMPDERAGLTDEDVAAAEAAFEQARAALEQENGRG